MAKLLTVWVLLGKMILIIGQEHFVDESTWIQQESNEETPIYSFGYGVADTQTGDVKTAWESKEGDTVNGHYSVIEPDGSMRTVQYSTGPKSGFTATVNNEDFPIESTAEESKLEDKSLRDYDRYYDYSQDEDIDIPYKANERKRNRNPYENILKEYSLMKRPKYPSDLEPSEYTHSFTIHHPRDELEPKASAQSHVGMKFDPNCKTKHKKIKSNIYNSDDLDFQRQKYPSLTYDAYDNNYDKYVSDPSNMDKQIHRHKYAEDYEPKYDWSLPKHSYSGTDSPVSDSPYNDREPLRPKKRYKPNKIQEHFTAEDLDDYILVPKRKLRKPPRIADFEYEPEVNEEFDETNDYEGYRKHQRPSVQKEVLRKIVKKTKPINLLDIFDI